MTLEEIEPSTPLVECMVCSNPNCDGPVYYLSSQTTGEIVFGPGCLKDLDAYLDILEAVQEGEKEEA